MTTSTTESAPKGTRSERKRTAILQAARESFRESGFDRTSMDAVASRAEVSKRTVYNHFPSKDELFTAVVQDLVDSTECDITLAYDPDQPLADQLKAFARQKLGRELKPDFIGLVRAVISDVARRPELGVTALTDLVTREDGLQIWLRAAHTDGRLHVPYPQVAAHQFWALAKGAAFWPVLAGLCETLPDVMLTKAVDESVAMLLDHYRVRGDQEDSP